MIDQHIKVEFNRKVSHDTFLLGFRSPEIAVESRPGQFVMLRVSRGMDPFLGRPFSICGVREGDLVYLLYRVVGNGTAILSQTIEGEELRVMGPLGRGFQSPENDKRLLIVAGGIGVAPLFFLAYTLKSRDMDFLAGFGSSGDIVNPDEVDGLAIHMSLATDDGTKGRAGTVVDLFGEYLDQDQGKVGDFSVYTCGPLPMLKRVVSMAEHRNIPCQVSLEAFMACGLGVCQGCAVKALSGIGQTLYYHVCKDGPVFYSHEIDWNSI
jgi:dihydroorotate dehydrogenase electron transfer subunit